VVGRPGDSGGLNLRCGEAAGPPAAPDSWEDNQWPRTAGEGAENRRMTGGRGEWCGSGCRHRRI